jgi:hypothetical protein
MTKYTVGLTPTPERVGLLLLRSKRGWKVYVLAWTWLGIAAWIVDSMPVAAIVWTFGASSGWMLAPTVSEKGWRTAVRFLAASLLMLASLVPFIGAYRIYEALVELESRRDEPIPSIQRGYK